MRFFTLTLGTVLLLLFTGGISAQTAFWEQLRGPYGGTVAAVEVCPSDGRIYVGTFDGLLFSDDDGMTWRYLRYDLIGIHALLADAAGKLVVGAISGISVFDNHEMTWTSRAETEPYVIWCLHRGMVSGTLFAGSNNSTVLRSTDAGESWSPVVVSTLSPNKVTAITSDTHGNVFLGTSATRVWKSTDDGLTWRNMSSTTQHSNVLAMGYDEIVDIVYVGVRDTIYASTDAGERWTAHVFGQDAVRYTLPLTVAAGGLLLIGTRTGVMESADHGLTWSQHVMGTADSAVSVMSRDLLTERVYIATKSGVYRMASGWKEWEPCGAPATDIYNIDVTGAERIVAATGSGIRVSIDGGANWAWSTLGLMFSTAHDAANGVMYAAGNSGVYRSTDLGSTWMLATSGPQGTRPWTVRVMPGGTVIAGFGALQNWGGVSVSRDLGLSWEEKNMGLVDLDVYWIEVDEESGDVFLCTVYGELYRSTDVCESWTSLPAPWTAASASLAVGSAGTLYAATCTKGIHVSNDAGQTWTQIGQGELATACANWITIDGQGCLYVGISAGGVWRSCDEGASWSRYGQDIAHYNVYCLDLSEDGKLYAGTELGGIFRIAVPTAVAGLPALPGSVFLEQNYPNPFTTSTTITLRGWRPGGSWTLRVYDVLGNMVCDLTRQAAEGPTATVERSMLPAPGVYCIELKTPAGSKTRTILHLR